AIDCPRRIDPAAVLVEPDGDDRTRIELRLALDALELRQDRLRGAAPLVLVEPLEDGPRPRVLRGLVHLARAGVRTVASGHQTRIRADIVEFPSDTRTTTRPSLLDKQARLGHRRPRAERAVHEEELAHRAPSSTLSEARQDFGCKRLDRPHQRRV